MRHGRSARCHPSSDEEREAGVSHGTVSSVTTPKTGAHEQEQGCPYNRAGMMPSVRSYRHTCPCPTELTLIGSNAIFICFPGTVNPVSAKCYFCNICTSGVLIKILYYRLCPQLQHTKRDPAFKNASASIDLTEFSQ